MSGYINPHWGSSVKDMAPPKSRRLYHVWKGSNKFFCGGRMIFGPDVASLFLSTFLIGTPAITFCGKVFAKVKNAQEISDQILWYPVLAVGLVVTFLDLMFLFLTSGRDPGIVPRNSRPPELDEAFEGNTPSMEWVNGRNPHMRLPRTKDVVVNGHVIKVKYCDTCLLYRPPRASHCSICNNCVQRFDHHCPWVGQCIGVRNYRFFFLFISSSTFLCIYVFSFSWVNILREKHNDSLWKTMSKEIICVILIVYCFIAVWFVGGLTIFHFYLICTNQTTYENFRYRYDKKENPYNKGMMRNIRELFFSRIPPSMNNFRAWVAEEDNEGRSVTSSIGGGLMGSKEKIDIEMGSKLAEDGGIPVPDLLQNLDYSGIEDNLKNKDADGGIVFDPFFFPIDHERRESVQSSTVEDETNTDEKNDEGSCSHLSTTPILHG
ncbi:probable protein S-acyltransferase 4 isoform X1 [Telopea speciosissima]|uniref:probable protein S-acyltransferase 4 isoform X1 n=1 Tax=Telopea speciosissima TaxID=54955 RepID=UPI001CC7AC92|nr:probable protein S-acyltransferase 4 isoform X1 [Telopea speciosissima]XP_043690410.1 probable protein S-acyltransferase 4 isoform X1 [Telopea speciosissima]